MTVVPRQVLVEVVTLVLVVVGIHQVLVEVLTLVLVVVAAHQVLVELVNQVPVQVAEVVLELVRDLVEREVQQPLA